jgi:hypothetical protein
MNLIEIVDENRNSHSLPHMCDHMQSLSLRITQILQGAQGDAVVSVNPKANGGKEWDRKRSGREGREKGGGWGVRKRGGGAGESDMARTRESHPA